MYRRLSPGGVLLEEEDGEVFLQTRKTRRCSYRRRFLGLLIEEEDLQVFIGRSRRPVGLFMEDEEEGLLVFLQKKKTGRSSYIGGGLLTKEEYDVFFQKRSTYIRRPGCLLIEEEDQQVFLWKKKTCKSSYRRRPVSLLIERDLQVRSFYREGEDQCFVCKEKKMIFFLLSS